MSHAHSKLYLCKVCNKEFYVPDYYPIEKVEDGLKVLTWINVYPCCNNEILKKDME